MAKKLKIYDLSQPLGVGIPLWPWAGGMNDFQQKRVSYFENGPKTASEITLKMHYSTHQDAPYHVVCDGMGIDEIPLESCYGEGVCLDIPTKKWEVITAEMLEEAAAKVPGGVKEGDFVVINTGWHKLFRKDNYAYMNYFGGMYKEAGEWLFNKKVKGVAIDQGALDHPCARPPLSRYMPWLDTEYKETTGKDPGEFFNEYEPCHHIFLENGITGYENIGGDIDKVTGKRCIFAGFPIRWEHGDGSCVRFVAITEEEE